MLDIVKGRSTETLNKHWEGLIAEKTKEKRFHLQLEIVKATSRV